MTITLDGPRAWAIHFIILRPMFPKPPIAGMVPSRSALRVLRQLAFAGSTIGAIGSACTVATITYDVHRRVHLAQRIVENKRNLQRSCPNYDSSSGAVTVAKMMEAAEAGEFNGLDSMRDRKKRRKKGTEQHTEAEEDNPVESDLTGNNSLISTIDTVISDATPPGKPSPQPTRSDQDTNKPVMPPIQFPRAAQVPPSEPKMNLPSATNQQVPAITSKFRLRYQDAQNIPPFVKIERLLDSDKPIQAAQLFLETHPASLSEGISVDRRELAVRVFYANIQAENVFLARSVFNRIDTIDEVTPALWEVLMLALRKRGNVDSIAVLYMAYSSKFSLSPTLLEVVLRALIDSYNLKDAKKLLYDNLEHDQNCGLCGIYLSGLWKKTRNVELLVTQFDRLLSLMTSGKRKITEKLFNPLLRAYIDVGKEEEAQDLAGHMEKDHDIQLSARTRGLFVYAKALKCDWEGVDIGLKKLHSLRLSVKQPWDFAKVFDRIFLEFWLANSGPAIRNFVFRAIYEYELVPDQVLFNHIMEAFVEKGDAEMVAELMETVEKRKWKISFDKENLMEMVRRRRLACEMSPVGLWQMFRASQEKFGQAATSQRILGYDRTSYPDNEAYKMPMSHEPTVWMRKAMQMIDPAKPINQFVSLHKQMIHCMQTGKWSGALDVYTTAKYAGKTMKQIHVELAIIASIMQKGFTDEARAILEDNTEIIRNFGGAVNPLFFQQVLQADKVGEAAAFKMAVFNFYRILETKLIRCKHHVTVAAATQLVAKGSHRDALDLLSAVYKSRFGRNSEFDGVAMKFFVRTFGGDGNLQGIKWGIYTALKRPSGLNRDFVVEVHRTLAALRSRPVIGTGQTSEWYYSELDRLDELAAFLPAPRGRGNSSVPPDGKGRNGRQRNPRVPNSRAKEMQPKPYEDIKDPWERFKSIDEVLTFWYEEPEFEKALLRTKSLPRGDHEDWSEDKVWEEHVGGST